jgi:cytoskeletal protein CcmA (bactofilin family)
MKTQLTGRFSDIILLVSFALSVAFFLPLSVHAAVVRSGDSVSVAETEVVPGDFYVAGGDVTISGIVEGDAYVMGGRVTINGTVRGDVFALGGTVNVHGEVGDDLRVVGGTVVVAESVEGDVAVFSGGLSTLSTAHVNGEVLFYGGEAVIEGEVKGAVHARAESLEVKGKVGGVDATLTGLLTLQDSAYVAGDVSYQSPKELARAPQALIDGDIVKGSVTKEHTRIFDLLLPFWFMALFSALVAVLLFRERLASILALRTRGLALAGALGLAIFFLMPFAFSLLFASVLGALVGGLLLVVYLGLVLASLIAMHVFAGALVARYAVKEYRISWLYAAIGVALVQGVLLIPVVGVIAVFGLFAVTLGLLTEYLYRAIRS